MRYPTAPRIAALLAAFSLVSSPVSAQGTAAPRADAHTWRLGLNAGAMMIRTPTQDATILPSAGAHIQIMANRSALIFGVDEAFGSEEESGLIRFNDVRRYQAVLVAHPFNKKLEPYFGLGGGVTQVVRPRVADIVSDVDLRDQLLDAASDASTSGFVTVLVGIQGRLGRFNAFAQYQLGSAPPDDKILRGVTHSILGGIRINLGSAREPVTARR